MEEEWKEAENWNKLLEEKCIEGKQKIEENEYNFYSERTKSVGLKNRWGVEKLPCTEGTLKVFISPVLK